MKLILLTQVFATLWGGLIWFVQIVHYYPLYANVGREQFPEYEGLPNRLTTWVVGPAMLIELVTAATLLKYSAIASSSLAGTCLGLLILIWVSTAALSFPADDALTSRFSAGAYRKLVNTNWIRTVAWTARGLILMVITSRHLAAD